MAVTAFTWDVSQWGDVSMTWVQPTFVSGTISDVSTVLAPFFTWGATEWDGQSATWAAIGYVGQPVGDAAHPEVVIAVQGETGAVSEAFAGSGLTAYVAPDNTGVYVTATTARLYDRLPALYRDADATVVPPTATVETTTVTTGTFDSSETFDSAEEFDMTGEDVDTGVVTEIPNPNGYPLLRWLSCLVDQAGDIEEIVNRLTSPTTSALTDPQTADVAWLPWLAQMVGVNLPNPVDPGKAQTAIYGALTGAQRGSKPSIAAAVARALTGSQTVTVTDHYQGATWKIQVDTLVSETPTVFAGSTPFTWGTTTWGQGEWFAADPIVSLIVTAKTKPAGFTLVHTTS
jgi:hypothetical protein